MAHGGNWMRSLREHFATTREAHPNDRLLIVFDLDGAVLDLVACTQRRSPARPGALQVIRWFQLQRSTSVGFTTRRPANERGEVMRLLGDLGQEVHAEFDGQLVKMNERDPGAPLALSRIDALGAFAAQGYRTFAVVDGDRDAIRTLSDRHHGDDILLLHALPTTDAPTDPSDAAAGVHFDLTTLIAEADLPQHVSLVWHGVNDEHNLGQFLRSSVPWAECDVRPDPHDRLVLHHDPFDRMPSAPGGQPLGFAAAVAAIIEARRCLKVDIKDGVGMLPQIAAVLDAHGVTDDRLWFNARIDLLGANGFDTLRSRCPDAIVQCPIDFLAPLAVAAPEQAQAILRTLTSWGINRLSVRWGTDLTMALMDRLREWGCAINVYGVPDLCAFLEAVLLLPQSVTADFNFPAWDRHGHGSGEQPHRIHYPAPFAAAHSASTPRHRRLAPKRYNRGETPPHEVLTLPLTW